MATGCPTAVGQSGRGWAAGAPLVLPWRPTGAPAVPPWCPTGAPPGAGYGSEALSYVLGALENGFLRPHDVYISVRVCGGVRGCVGVCGGVWGCVGVCGGVCGAGEVHDIYI